MKSYIPKQVILLAPPDTKVSDCQNTKSTEETEKHLQCASLLAAGRFNVWRKISTSAPEPKPSKAGASGTKHTLSAIVLLFIFLLLAACTPADTPPNLRFTPGPTVVIVDNTFTADTYSLRFPDGWRVVTGQADAPQTATFVSPDNCSIILVSVSPIDPITSRDCGDLEFQTTTQDVQLDTATLTVAGSAPAEQWEAFLVQLERLIASVRAR